ncbi:hypothetical protein ONZ43_g6640 [Nemania bipapillata]|uniref:Uncharacterized protein n=1 Tax=Nemania bipapillata TaxID=110536 RepID=A0ACC2HXB3_9PEZI|nr:hypothetical protein ONZ43_g6640 [Nemania bipapillata]
MGIIGHPVIYNLPNDADLQEHVVSLLHDVSPAVGTTVDFNATIVMNYTSSHAYYTINQAGLYILTPTLQCWNGTLVGCGDDDGLEGRYVQACGYVWLDDDQNRLPTGQQKYKALESFRKLDSIPQGVKDDIQPAYEDVACQATVKQNGDGKSAASTPDVNVLALAFAVVYSAFNNHL